MTSSFRVLHFSPNPLAGAWLPVGAVVVQVSQIELYPTKRVVRAPDLGFVKCVGGSEARSFVDRLLARAETLELATAGGPVPLGANAQLGDLYEVPKWVDDVDGYITEFISLHGRLDSGGKGRRHRARVRGKSIRARHGFKFLEQKDLGEFIRPTYDPAIDGADVVDIHYLPKASQWGGSASAPLVLEPVSLYRSPADAVKDAKTAVRTLALYRSAAGKQPNWQPTLVAYVLGPIRDFDTQTVPSLLGEVPGVDVFVVDDRREAARFADRVRELV